ncbi:MAG: hypothetical protein R2781_11510 [Flavobacteriaceae bacterium]
MEPFFNCLYPLREYIPGYSSTSLKKKATELAYETDSLQQKILVNQQYLASIKKVLTGDVKAEKLQQILSLVVQQEISEVVFTLQASPYCVKSIM